MRARVLKETVKTDAGIDLILISIFLLLLLIPDSSFAEKRPEIQDIALGLRDGKVVLLNLKKMSIKRFNTATIPNSFTLGIAYFPECNKLAFDVFGVGQQNSRDLGIINLNNDQIVYWDTAKIGLGKKIYDAALSQLDSKVIIGRFADKYSNEVPETNFKENEKTIKAGLFNVCNESWQPLSDISLPYYKIFTGRLSHPILQKKFKGIYEKLKAQHLIPEEAKWDALIWIDDYYVLFRLEDNLLIGSIEGDEVKIIKKIDLYKMKLDSDIIQPNSAVFVYMKN